MPDRTIFIKDDIAGSEFRIVAALQIVLISKGDLWNVLTHRSPTELSIFLFHY